MFEIIENALMSKIFWITAIALLFYLYFKIVVYSYWKKHGVPHDNPTVPFGTLEKDVFVKQLSISESLRKSYDKFKKYPFHGLYMFHKPILMLNDPEVIKHVLVKEYSSFPDRGIICNIKIDPLNGNLFFITGEKWRALRIKLSPTLTLGKIKHMYPFAQEIAYELANTVDEHLVKTDILEFKDLMARYTTDTIFSLAFGFDSKTLKDPVSDFRHYGDLSVRNSPLINVLSFFAPSVMELLNIPFTDHGVTKFFIAIFKEMVEKRRKSKETRKDFLNLLLELMDYGEIKDKESNDQDLTEIGGLTKLEMLEAAAQAFVFFAAGFETTSSLITYTLYELALNPEEQEKVYQEITKMFEKNESFSFENVMHLKYLEMAFHEAMRKHPSIPIINRVCIKDCKLPNSDYVIPKGMSTIISISAIQRDPSYYPDPDKFDPTRFSQENIASRQPFTFLSFGEGPRHCIGKRLGIMLSMIALSTLISKYKLSICDKTPIPNRYSTDSLLQSPKDGIYLKVEKRKLKH